ncbi:hypothetical protein [Actinomadura sp. 3N508]|uniref:hypothetical protein n=1 Tax=Actinomadura sp. 3N508 TaxID=3375153 RepID=UPI0037902B93
MAGSTGKTSDHCRRFTSRVTVAGHSRSACSHRGRPRICWRSTWFSSRSTNNSAFLDRSAGPAWIGTPQLADCGGSQRHLWCVYRGWTLHMLWRTFVTTMLDAGVDPRDVRIAARHTDPRTTMC